MDFESRVAIGVEAFSRAPQIEPGVFDLRGARTVTTVLVAPFTEGAAVDSSGIGDGVYVVFDGGPEGAWDEGGHHTFVKAGIPELKEAARRLGVRYII